MSVGLQACAELVEDGAQVCGIVPVLAGPRRDVDCPGRISDDLISLGLGDLGRGFGKDGDGARLAEALGVCCAWVCRALWRGNRLCGS